MTSRDPAPGRSMRLEATRTSTLWTVVGVGAVITLLMLVFVAQNSDSIEWHFLWVDFTMSGGLAVLFGVVIGALLVVAVGVARLLQVRVAARRHRHIDERLAEPQSDPVTAGAADEDAVGDPLSARPAPPRPVD